MESGFCLFAFALCTCLLKQNAFPLESGLQDQGWAQCDISWRSIKNLLDVSQASFPNPLSSSLSSSDKITNTPTPPQGFLLIPQTPVKKAGQGFYPCSPKRQLLWRCKATQEWGHLEAGLQSQVVLSFPCTGGWPLAGCDQWHPTKSCLIRSWPRNGWKESGWQWGYLFEFGFINQIT